MLHQRKSYEWVKTNLLKEANARALTSERLVLPKRYRMKNT